MKKYNKVIFLGEDNTRLSPITEVLFQQKLKEAEKDDLIVCSRGIVVLFPEPVNQKITRISKAYGLDLSDYHAIELKASDLSADTLTLAMDISSKDMAYEKFPTASNIYTLKEFLGSSGDLKLPLGGTVDEYATIVEIISGLLDLLIEKLYNEDEE
jgi:protein-tyrosine-phosphatase